MNMKLQMQCRNSDDIIIHFKVEQEYYLLCTIIYLELITDNITSKLLNYVFGYFVTYITFMFRTMFLQN